MSKNDFVEKLAKKFNFSKKLAKKFNFSKKDAEDCCHVVVDALVEVIDDEKKFRFLNFGTFSIVERKARSGVNPLTKAKINIPAKKVLKFKPSKNLAEKIANS